MISGIVLSNTLSDSPCICEMVKQFSLKRIFFLCLQIYVKEEQKDGGNRRTVGIIDELGVIRCFWNTCTCYWKELYRIFKMTITASTERMDTTKDLPKKKFINTNLLSLKLLLFLFFGGTFINLSNNASRIRISKIVRKQLKTLLLCGRSTHVYVPKYNYHSNL